ncbi:hypothetical protein GCM10023310_41590 [Paenibacillus vulneris]
MLILSFCLAFFTICTYNKRKCQASALMSDACFVERAPAALNIEQGNRVKFRRGKGKHAFKR